MNRFQRGGRRLRPIAMVAAAAGMLALATTGRSSIAHHAPALPVAVGQPSGDYWASHQDDHSTPLAVPVSTVYEGNTDQTFLNLIKQASTLPQAARPWTNVGPFNGVVDIPGVGSGNEGFGPVDGIGTTIAVDPSDPSGSTAYLGTIGGIYKTTDGGKSVIDIGGEQLARDSIGAVAVDPSDPRTVYAGTGVSLFTLSDDAAGVGTYVSHDAGKTWTRPASNTHGYGTNAISVGTDGTVLVGTNYGVWRSADHGASFQQVPIPDNATHSGPAPLPLGSWVTAIVRNPANEQEVTLAVGYGFGKKVYPDGEVIAPGNGLYRSTNGGASWSYLPSTAALATAADSPDPFGRTSLAYSTAPGGKGVLWAMVADAGKTAGMHSCVDTPAVPVCVDGGSVLNGVYRSGDDGATWQVEATPQILATAFFGTTNLVGNAISYGPGVQGQYNNWIVADPVDPNRVYIGLEETFTGQFHDPTAGALPGPSTSWAAVEKYANICGFFTYYNTIPNSNGAACPSPVPGYGSGTSHPDQHSAAFATTPTGFRLYSGNDGGWWSQDAHTVSDSSAIGYAGFENGGWTSLGKPPTVLPWDVARLQDGSYLLALQDNGVAHVRPDGTAYQVCGGDGVYVFPGANPSSYYCGIDGQTILATTDDMKTTITVTPSNNSVGATFLSPWTVDPTNSDHLLAAAGNVDETLDGPRSNTYDPTDEALVSSTWHTVFTPPAAPHGPWDSSAVFARGNVDYVSFCSACRPSLASGTAANPQVVTDRIATNVKVGCKAAAGTAACWHMAASVGLPHEQVSGIAVDPNDPETLYVSLRQLLILGADPKATGAQRVMVSHDGGASFTDLTGNLPSAEAHRIELRGGRLYVATDVGIFTAPVTGASTASAAHTLSWSRFDTRLPAVTYRSMKLDPTGRYLVAGAYGRGGWVYDLGASVPAAPGPTKSAPAGTGGSATGTAPSNTSGGSSNGGGSARSASGVLGHTGIDILAIVVAGLVLIVVGCYLLVTVRERRSRGSFKAP